MLITHGSYLELLVVKMDLKKANDLLDQLESNEKLHAMNLMELMKHSQKSGSQDNPADIQRNIPVPK